MEEHEGVMQSQRRSDPCADILLKHTSKQSGAETDKENAELRVVPRKGSRQAANVHKRVLGNGLGSKNQEYEEITRRLLRVARHGRDKTSQGTKESEVQIKGAE